MKVNQKQQKLIISAIDEWENNELIDTKKADELKASLDIQSFDWKNLAYYSFIVAVICIVVAILSVLADEVIMRVIDSMMNAGTMPRIILFAVLSSLCFWFGLKRRKQYPAKQLSNEALFLLGIFFSAISLFYIGEFLKVSEERYTWIIFLAAILYAFLGVIFPSIITWMCSLVVLGIGFGSETTRLASESAYFLGMNMPLRLLVFSCLLIGIAYLLKKRQKLAPFASPTYYLGLLSVFFFLWILSIFGNYGKWADWEAVKQYELLGYSVLLTVFCLGAIYYGLRFGNRLSRELGIIFMILNIYTRYVEYLWDRMHTAIFFAVLATSFWLLGKKAEQIWQFGKTKN